MFKKGSLYSRKDVGWILLPEEGRPAGGDWDTGYVRVDNKLIIFMNIGIPGATGHDFDNYYDHKNKTIVWYGKPRSHSNQPTFQKLFDYELTPHFFARWDKNSDFTYLGIGKIISFKDGHPTVDSNGKEVETIELKLNIDDSEEIIIPIRESAAKNESPLDTPTIKSSFALEKHLEDFLIKNWKNTDLSRDYEIFEKDNKKSQFPTRSGPIDILAISKDKSHYLVIELKKGRASDEVVGQISRYIGYIKQEIATSKQEVKGLIIALENDRNLKDALYGNSSISFIKYKINFELEG
mgnify:CR=1 FL=1